MKTRPSQSFMARDAVALRRLASAGLVAGLAALATLPAQAAVVVGTFDPAFGAAIPNLGYRGTVTLDVPAACFALTPGLIANGNPCSNGNMVVLSSTVEFYNVLESGTPTFASQGFSFAPLAIASIVTGAGPSLLGVNAANSLVQTLSLFDDGPDNTIGTSDDVAYLGDFTLNFEAIDPAQQAGPGPFYTAGMTAQCRPTTGAQFCEDPTPQNSDRAVTEFQAPRLTVPEPSGLALVMGALAAAWTTRRRKAGSA